nr:kunitz-type serine protease inhibitor 2-like [Drosophila suzukii]
MKFIFFVYILVPIIGSAMVKSEGICSLPIEPGRCKAMIRKFAYKPSNKGCVPFVYGGCGGNGNRFDSIQSCDSACKGK